MVANVTVGYGGWIVSKVQSLFWRRVTSLRRGVVSTGGGAFQLEGCVLISRRGSSSSGVGGHTSLEEGCILIARRGSYFRPVARLFERGVHMCMG